MKAGHLGLGGALAAGIVAFAHPALATGVCDEVSPQACIDAISNAGGVVNDIFKDAQGLTGPQLPVFAKLYDNWPGCPTSFAGCAGTDTAPYDCPGQYTCAAPTNDFATASQFLNALDHTWWHPCRAATSGLDANGCPLRTCIADGTGGNYNPWEGAVFDLGGPSNQVVIFATNDHGPQPCESTEYTVFLSDNPLSQDIIQQPTTTGADPQKWNRAVLKQIFTEGWYQTRQPDVAGHGTSCGDTATYAVEQDSFVTVYTMPCGITFRYAAIVAGNDGQDFPECAFNSNEAELDAVAGLTEEGKGVCPDADKDGFVDCSCTGAPAVCDCNDADPAVHPGAPEACDSPDLNCDGVPGSCSAGLFCVDSVCVPPCGSGELGSCPAGSACQDTDVGKLCVPTDCTAGCPAGSVCDPATKTCKPACDGVTCPYGQKCQDGQCKDLCAGVVCPNQQQCYLGACKPRCDCFSGDVGCVDTPGLSCDRGGTNQCVPSVCVGKSCASGEHCDTSGNCVGLCDGVTCPVNQKCVAASGGCVSKCDGVTCGAGTTCDPTTGTCKDTSCDNVTCIPPSVCVAGSCVTPDGGGGAPDGGPDGSGSGGTSGGGGGGPPRGSTASGDSGGCGCRVAGLPQRGALDLGALAALLALALRRRRRG